MNEENNQTFVILNVVNSEIKYKKEMKKPIKIHEEN